MTQSLATRVLSDAQIQQFITHGWTKLEAAFSPEVAAPCVDFLWDKLVDRGIRRDDQATWKQPMAFIAENYDTPPFAHCATPRLDQAVTELVGDGRWHAQGKVGWWGWWPVNFGVGADQPWDVPSDEWHFDSPPPARYITSGEQGLLTICLFSELESRGGGTLIAEGSHRLVARAIHETPGMTQQEGIAAVRQGHPWMRALCGLDGGDRPASHTGSGPTKPLGTDIRTDLVRTPRMQQFMDRVTIDETDGGELRVVELTGSPGDVFLGHPLLFHSPSFNHSGRPRFMCNRKAVLYDDLQLDRADGAYSPLEESIRRAIT